ncbi:MAG: patatin [Phenylobacterium sp.]|uniref:patatin-like phospholipase family protein n=1 Tax=Phenylobacterium sp. TaxID=1871053 RepID=UPI0025FDAA79|nr:patatin-like phospholipase family protein [Phenylobacterium sp.]MBA4013283.1 patatin [Phenylobacterium sp.]
MSRRSVLVVFALALLAAPLAGCASFSREDFTADEAYRALPPTAADIRFDASDQASALAFTNRTQRQLAAAGDRRVDVLAISGGGADGAYGAGVMVGWTKAGTRPSFEVVTGVSTGALIAPFAFLGPHWDKTLFEAYAGGKASQVLKGQGLGVLFSSSLYSPEYLRALVETYCTSVMLHEVAQEHAKGRRLLIATTNLDSQQTVVWDMGAIASRGGPDALKLFRDVLVASAAIPGVFPPVIIPIGDADGRQIDEMHVDGGVTAPFVSIPEGLYFWEAPEGQTTMPGRIFVLVNGKLDPSFAVVRGRAPTILGRAFDTMMKTNLRAHIAANRAFAARNNMEFEIAEVPRDAESGSLNFEPESMRRLFKLGEDNAIAGKAWARPD